MMALDEAWPGSGGSGDWPAGASVVDLSLPIRDGGPSYPGDPACTVAPYLWMPRDAANVSVISIGSHQATHVDAPRHFLADGAPVDEIPIEQTVGPALLIDLSDRAPRSSIEVEAFTGHDVRPGDRLVYRLGWDRHLHEPGYFTEMPRLSVEAARWLAGRRLALLGMDAPTPNPEAAVEVHQVLLGAGTVLLEGLANLHRLQPGRFWLSAAPLRVSGGDGAPVRAFGVQCPPG